MKKVAILSSFTMLLAAALTLFPTGNLNAKDGVEAKLGKESSKLVVPASEAKPLKPKAVDKKLTKLRKKPKKQRKLDVNSLLNEIQARVAVKKALPEGQKEVTAAVPQQEEKPRGLKPVETKAPASVDSDYYLVPGSDILLDQGDVGELSPSDDIVD